MNKSIWTFVVLAIVVMLLITWHIKRISAIPGEVVVQKHLRSSSDGSSCDHGGTGACLPTDVKKQYEHQDFPSAIIIGSKKCGTRALLLMLSAHPKVEIAHAEMHYFDSAEFYDLGNNWYRSKMPALKDGQISLEKTPSYMYFEYVPGRVFAFSPSIKLMAILRNPVARLLSDYVQLQELREQKHWDLMPPVNEMFIENKTLHMKNLKPITVGLYVSQLEKWFQYFPRQQILILDGDKLIKDPIPILKEAEEFLGLPPHFNNKNVYFNKTKGFYCWIDSGENVCLSGKKGRKHPQITAEQREIMTSYYKPYNAKLFRLVNKSFEW